MIKHLFRTLALFRTPFYCFISTGQPLIIPINMNNYTTPAGSPTVHPLYSEGQRFIFEVLFVPMNRIDNLNHPNPH